LGVLDTLQKNGLFVVYHGIICKIYQNMQINSDNQMLPKMVWHPNIRRAKVGSWGLKTGMKILQTIEFHIIGSYWFGISNS
jgi:hypothetical protein